MAGLSDDGSGSGASRTTEPWDIMAEPDNEKALEACTAAWSAANVAAAEPVPRRLTRKTSALSPFGSPAGVKAVKKEKATNKEKATSEESDAGQLQAPPPHQHQSAPYSQMPSSGSLVDQAIQSGETEANQGHSQASMTIPELVASVIKRRPAAGKKTKKEPQDAEAKHKSHKKTKNRTQQGLENRYIQKLKASGKYKSLEDDMAKKAWLMLKLRKHKSVGCTPAPSTCSPSRKPPIACSSTASDAHDQCAEASEDEPLATKLRRLTAERDLCEAENEKWEMELAAAQDDESYDPEQEALDDAMDDILDQPQDKQEEAHLKYAEAYEADSSDYDHEPEESSESESDVSMPLEPQDCGPLNSFFFVGVGSQVEAIWIPIPDGTWMCWKCLVALKSVLQTFWQVVNKHALP